MLHSLTRALRRLTCSREGRDLAVLTYHRVGRASDTPFDPWLFTETEALDAHVRYIKRRFRIVGLEEALAIASGGARSRGMAVLLTFDDGYRDNYEQAFPLLQAHGVSAVFFLVSSFTAGGVIPWWDQVAWIVNSTQKKQICLTAPGRTVRVDLTGKDRDAAVKIVLDCYKASANTSTEAFVGEIEALCDLERPLAQDRMFVSWSEARQMKAAGMSIGSHTHTHQILARMSETDQFREVELSRRLLERELGGPADVFAYPVGGAGDFTDVTTAALRSCGYRAAFSSSGGFNTAGQTRMHDIKRLPVYRDARAAWLFER